MYINSRAVHVAYNLQAVRNYWKQFPCEWVIDSKDSRWMQILSAWRWGKMILVNFNEGQIVCDFTRADRHYLEKLAKRATLRQSTTRMAEYLVRKYEHHTVETIIHNEDGTTSRSSLTFVVNKDSTIDEVRGAIKAISNRLFERVVPQDLSWDIVPYDFGGSSLGNLS